MAEGHPSPLPSVTRPWWRRSLASLRSRVVGLTVAVVAVALLASTLVVRQVLLTRVELEARDAMLQERAELETLVTTGVDPGTSEPWLSVEPLWDTVLRRNLPAPTEMFVTFVGEEAVGKQPSSPPYDVTTDAELLTQWAPIAGQDSSRFGEDVTPVGEIDWLAVPVRIEAPDGAVSLGTFVVVEFTGLLKQRVEETVRIAGVVGLAMLLLGTSVAWGLSSRLLTPVRQLSATARKVSESDLTRRLDVDGYDELADMAATFNQMLHRLEEAFHSQRQFVDDAGHELRTPITIIRGHLELLGDDPAERAETVALVTDELDRMNRMVDDLLVLARAEQPDFLTKGAVDVASFTDDVLTKASALGDRRWQLAERATGVVEADRQRLTQAMVQLAANAAQHTEPGDVIEVGSRRTAGELWLWVADSGPGIAEEDRAHIFERFARGRGARRRSDGAGLGLAIVRAIAEAHGGRIVLSSEAGVGSRFTVVVPVTAHDVDVRPAAEGS